MRYIAIVVVALVGCTRESSGPACKAAVEKAHTAGIHMTPKEVTQTIGTCAEKEWSAEARTCVAAAKTGPELEACATRFKLDGAAMHASADIASAIAKMGEFKDQMCACKDMACVQNVSDAMTKWSQDMAKQQDTPPKMTDEQTKQATEIGEQMGRCMQKAMAAGQPGDSANPKPGQDAVDDRGRVDLVK